MFAAWKCSTTKEAGEGMPTAKQQENVTSETGIELKMQTNDRTELPPLDTTVASKKNVQ